MTPHICPVCHSTSVATRSPTWAKVMLLIGLIPWLIGLVVWPLGPVIWPLGLVVWSLGPVAIICVIFIRSPTCRSCNARAIPAATPHGRQLMHQHGIKFVASTPKREKSDVETLAEVMAWLCGGAVVAGAIMYYLGAWS